jgi:hypothetical protein
MGFQARRATSTIINACIFDAFKCARNVHMCFSVSLLTMALLAMALWHIWCMCRPATVRMLVWLGGGAQGMSCPGNGHACSTGSKGAVTINLAVCVLITQNTCIPVFPVCVVCFLVVVRVIWGLEGSGGVRGTYHMQVPQRETPKDTTVTSNRGKGRCYCLAYIPPMCWKNMGENCCNVCKLHGTHGAMGCCSSHFARVHQGCAEVLTRVQSQVSQSTCNQIKCSW